MIISRIIDLLIAVPLSHLPPPTSSLCVFLESRGGFVGESSSPPLPPLFVPVHGYSCECTEDEG